MLSALENGGGPERNGFPTTSLVFLDEFRVKKSQSNNSWLYRNLISWSGSQHARLERKDSDDLRETLHFQLQKKTFSGDPIFWAIPPFFGTPHWEVWKKRSHPWDPLVIRSEEWLLERSSYVETAGYSGEHGGYRMGVLWPYGDTCDMLLVM